MRFFADRVMVATNTAGSGVITLGAPLPGFRDFQDAEVPDGVTVSFLIENQGLWEISHGVYDETANTLTRVLDSSSTGALLPLVGASTVSIMAGSKNIFFRDSENPQTISQNGRLWLTVDEYQRQGGDFITLLTFANCAIMGGGPGGLTWNGQLISRSADGAAMVVDDERASLVGLQDIGEGFIAGGSLFLENTAFAPTAPDQVLGSIVGRGKWDPVGSGENPTTAFIAFVAEGPWSQANCPMAIVFGTTDGRDPVERYRITSDGYFLMKRGLRFPAVPVPSTDPNTLDDYQEVAFTPVLKLGGASTGITYNVAASVGRATKIGRLVWYELSFTLTSKGTATGAATVEGFPYSAVNANPTGNAFAKTFGAAATVTDPFGVFSAGLSSVSLRNFNAGTYATMTDADFTNTTTVRLSGFYTAG